MLDAMRRGAQSWAAKILFGILILSFGVFWNVGDTFRGAGRGSLAKVGEADVTAFEFDRELRRELDRLSQDAGRRITPEQARLAGLDRLVLQRLVSDAAIAGHANGLSLAVSDDVLLENLKRDESLKGPDGKFSRRALDDAMSRMGLNEQSLLVMLRKDEVKRQLLSALSNSVAVSTTMAEAQHAWKAETRKIEHFKIDAATVKVPEPDDTALKTTYDSNKPRFVVPEFRKIAALVLASDDLKKEMTIAEDEVKKRYEETKATYDVPERRRIQQIAFKDKAAAEEAKKALDGGKNFRDVAKDAGATEADINLGLVTKKQLIDPAIAEAAFKLERDKVSAVIEGRFRPVIVRVVEIQPGKESTFAEVKDKIQDTLARTKASEEVQKRYELVEEQRNLGKTLKEIADALKLRFIEAEAADRTNKRPDGGRAVDHADERAIVEAAFASDKGLENDAVTLKQSDGYAWVDVLAVTETKEKPFEDAKADVKTLHIENETRKQLAELATKLVERLDGGEDIAKVAKEAGGEAQATDAITRMTTPPGLDEDAVEKAFALAKGKAGSANTADGKTRAVFRVIDIIPAPAATPEQKEKLVSDLRAELREDQIDAYVRGLQGRLGVEINEAEFKRASGADQQ